MNTITKEWFDRLAASEPGRYFLGDMSRRGVSVEVIAIVLADSIAKHHASSPFTIAQEEEIEADLRSGSANQYIAGLLGYV